MDKIYIIYKTDSWHSYASRDIIGVGTSKGMAILLCQQQARKEGHKITQDQLFNLNTISQTQGYNGEGEFQFEEVNTDVLL